MEQMILILVVVLLIWLGVGVGQGSASLGRRAAPGRPEPRAATRPPQERH